MASVVDLTTSATASARPGLSGVTEIASLITAASEAISNYVGYLLYFREDVEETCAGGTIRLFLKAGAVTTLTSVTCYDTARDTTTYVLEDATKGIVRSNTDPWPFTGRNAGGVSEAQTWREDTGKIVVVFDCGWVTPGQVAITPALTRTLPQVFEEACILTVLGWTRGRDPNVTSRSLGDASISYGSAGPGGALPLPARTLLARYKKAVAR